MKLDETDRVTIIGDSLAKGIVYDDASKKLVQLQDCAAALIAKNYPAEFCNKSAFGLTLKKAAARNMVTSAVSERREGRHFVAVALGGNDSDFRWEEVAAHPEQEHFSQSRLEEFASLLENTIGEIKAAGAIPVVFSIPPLDPDRYFLHISERVEGKNVLQWLRQDVGNIYRYQESFNVQILKSAMENDCILMDTRSSLLRTLDYENYLCADGIHLNAAGHSFLAEEAVRLINAL